jgi:hypothetical protein
MRAARTTHPKRVHGATSIQQGYQNGQMPCEYIRRKNQAAHKVDTLKRQRQQQQQQQQQLALRLQVGMNEARHAGTSARTILGCNQHGAGSIVAGSIGVAPSGQQPLDYLCVSLLNSNVQGRRTILLHRSPQQGVCACVCGVGEQGGKGKLTPGCKHDPHHPSQCPDQHQCSQPHPPPPPHKHYVACPHLPPSLHHLQPTAVPAHLRYVHICAPGDKGLHSLQTVLLGSEVHRGLARSLHGVTGQDGGVTLGIAHNTNIPSMLTPYAPSRDPRRSSSMQAKPESARMYGRWQTDYQHKPSHTHSHSDNRNE